MSISESAIVAGAKAMDAYWGGRYAPDEVEELRGEVTAMLEAAAPIIRAGVLEAAAEEIDRLRAVGKTPYAECTEYEARAWWAFAEVTPEEWLRARAMAERGEG